MKDTKIHRDFIGAFQLVPDSAFGKLLNATRRLLGELRPQDSFTRNACDFWRKSFASKPKHLPSTWKPFFPDFTSVNEMPEDQLMDFMFCLETVHVLIARLMLAKACEDQNFPHVTISKTVLAEVKGYRGPIKPVEYGIALYQLHAIMRDNLIESIFAEDIFCWWLNAFTPYESMSRGELQLAQVSPNTDDFGEAIAHTILTLYRFDFTRISADPLGDLYQHSFDKETRRALGEFYTGEEIIDYILDEIGYQENIIGKRLIDLACGSGSFCVQAWRRYLAELNQAEVGSWAQTLMELCHKPHIVGLDIHPFACVIAQIRLMIELIPYYKRALDEDVNFSIKRLPIFRTDSLLIESDTAYRSRVPIEMEYEYVVGNPPYVMKQIPPKQRQLYQELYHESISGKLNYFRLFIHRGIMLLSDDGKLGYITPSSYLSDAYGRELRKYIMDKCKILHILEAPESAKLFEGVTQAAAISIFQKCGDAAQRRANIVKAVYGITGQEDLLPEKRGALEQYYIEQATYENLQDEDTPLIPIPPAWFEVIETIKLNAIRLDKIVKIRQGINKTTYKSLFHGVPGMGRKPVIDGDDISPFYLDIKNGDKKMGWLEADELPAERIRDASVERIVTQHPSNMNQQRRLKGGICPPGCYPNDSSYYLLLIEHGDESLPNYSLKYLLGLMYSSTLSFYFNVFSRTNNISKRELARLPIRQINSANHDVVSEIESIVDILILDKHIAGNHIAKLDESVYKLYELDEEKQQIIKKFLQIYEGE